MFKKHHFFALFRVFLNHSATKLYIVYIFKKSLILTNPTKKIWSKSNKPVTSYSNLKLSTSGKLVFPFSRAAKSFDENYYFSSILGPSMYNISTLVEFLPNFSLFCPLCVTSIDEIF